MTLLLYTMVHYYTTMLHASFLYSLNKRTVGTLAAGVYAGIIILYRGKVDTPLVSSHLTGSCHLQLLPHK
jgi:hypothetical protein